MMNSPVYGTRWQRLRWVPILLALAGGLRVGWVTARYSGDRSEQLEYPDEEAYCQIARSLAAGQGLVDEFGYRATYMPGYPGFLALLAGLPHSLFWTRLVQALLGAWLAPATYLLARRWLAMAGPEGNTPGEGDLLPVLAGLAVAVDPFLLFFSGLLLTETLFALCLATAWLVLLPMCQANRRIGASSVIGTALLLWLCLMLRPSSAILVLLVPAVVVLPRRFDRAGLMTAAAVVALVLAGLAPWAIRNYRVIGQWRWLTTRGGISLYDAVRPGSSGESDLADTKSLPELQGLDELHWDAYFRAKARAEIRRDPMRIVSLAGRKFLRTWSLRPNVEAYHQGAAAIVGASWTTAVLVLAAAGWWRYRRALGAWLVLLSPVIAFTLLHMVFVGSVRYRLPLMPMMLVLSAAGLAGIIGGLGAARRRSA
jgi:hypothetical protein